jgi:hypothetical protein
MEQQETKAVHATFINLGPQDPQPYHIPAMGNMLDIIPFGSDNQFPQALALFARTSPNHRGIINSKHQYILGDGIVPTEENDQQTLDLISHVNFEKEDLTEVTSRTLLDDLMIGNGWTELITDRNRTFLWFNQLDSTKCRLMKDKKRVAIHPDWSMDKGASDPDRKILPLYPNFEKDGTGPFAAYRCVYHKKRYEPEFSYYGIPQYVSSQDSIQIDLKTNKWNLARLKNAFKVSGVLVIPVRDKAESKAVIDNIKKNHVGEDNQAKLFTITKTRARGDEKADQTQLIETQQGDEGSWLDLHKQSMSDMIVAHAWYRSLIGIADNTGFDTQRILNEYEMALNSVITNYQKEYIKMYKKLYREVIGLDVEIQFRNRAPMDDDKYYKVWELRKQKGLEYDETDPAQQIIVGVKNETKITVSE